MVINSKETLYAQELFGCFSGVVFRHWGVLELFRIVKRRIGTRKW